MKMKHISKQVVEHGGDIIAYLVYKRPYSIGFRLLVVWVDPVAKVYKKFKRVKQIYMSPEATIWGGIRTTENTEVEMDLGGWRYMLKRSFSVKELLGPRPPTVILPKKEKVGRKHKRVAKKRNHKDIQPKATYVHKEAVTHDGETVLLLIYRWRYFPGFRLVLGWLSHDNIGYRKIKRSKLKHNSINGAISCGKRLVKIYSRSMVEWRSKRWRSYEDNPPAITPTVRYDLNECGVHWFEYNRQRRTEWDGQNMMDKFFMMGTNSLLWPHDMIKKEYRSKVSTLVDDVEDEEDEEDDDE